VRFTPRSIRQFGRCGKRCSKVDGIVRHACCAAEQKLSKDDPNNIWLAKAGFGGTEYLLSGVLSEGSKRGMSNTGRLAFRLRLCHRNPVAQTLAEEGFSTAVERYLVRKKASVKPSSFSEIERYLRNRSRPLHSLHLEHIDRRKIAALLGEIETASGPVNRNRERTELSSFFNWSRLSCVSMTIVFPLASALTTF
jgi:hypothetical protein